MAGYIMTLSDIDSLTYCVKTGTYSTNLGTPKGELDQRIMKGHLLTILAW